MISTVKNIFETRDLNVYLDAFKYYLFRKYDTVYNCYKNLMHTTLYDFGIKYDMPVIDKFEELFKLDSETVKLFYKQLLLKTLNCNLSFLLKDFLLLEVHMSITEVFKSFHNIDLYLHLDNVDQNIDPDITFKNDSVITKSLYYMNDTGKLYNHFKEYLDKYKDYICSNSLNIIYNQAINLCRNCLMILLSNNTSKIKMTLSDIDIDYYPDMPHQELKFYLGSDSLVHISIVNGVLTDERF